LKILLSVLFGAFGGVVIAFALELIGDRLETAERAETILGVPVLASLPMTLRMRRPALLPSPQGRQS
jgi:capsular polysaccharide biosynthesis protein